MNPLKIKDKQGPEAKIQDRLVKKLRGMEWFVKETHGNLYQSGLPDLLTGHIKYGSRWIEVKNPYDFSFTPAQQQDFPKMKAVGIGIWILFGDEDAEILKLWKPANWWDVYYNWTHNLPVQYTFPKV